MGPRAESAYAPPSPPWGAPLTLLRELQSTGNRSGWPEPPPGRGRPAMLVPGFLAGDPSLARMALWLRASGWRTVRPGVRFNVNCTEAVVEALERRLDEAVEGGGARALLVGQSRGGTMGRVLAVRRPDLIETLVTLGSPVLDQMAVSRTTRAMVNLVAGLGTLGVPGLFSRDCRAGVCCELSRAQLSHPVSEDVRYV